MSKKEIMELVNEILTNNEIKVSYENNICVVSKNTALGWKPVIFVDNTEEQINIDGVVYRL